MFVLVFWVDTNQTSILDESFVMDKTMLDDSVKVGMVKHGDLLKKAPKHGWKAYAARVLAVNDSRSVLLKKEDSFLQDLAGTSAGSSTTTSLDDRTGRARRKKRAFSSEEEAETHAETNEEETKRFDGERQRKRKAAGRRQMADFMKSATISLESSSDDEDGMSDGAGMKILALEKTVAEMKQKIKKLERQNLLLQEGLGDRLSKVVEDALANCGNVHATSINSTEVSAVANHPNEPEAKSEDKQFISSAMLQQILRAKDMGKITCQLMTSIFSPKEMSTSLVTGRRLKPEDKDRPVLDQEKVNYILATVLQMFPCAQPSEVRSKMAQKCKDLRASQKRQAAAATLDN